MVGSPAPVLGTEAHARLLPAALDDLTSTLRRADLGADVAACPGWRVVELAEHVGTIHRWAAAAVRAADPDAPPSPSTSDPAPTDARERDALVDRSAGCGAELLAALRGAGPDDPAWGFGPPPRTTAFWWRRMVHETALHTWDVRAAQRAGPPTTVSDDPVLALDGLDEVVGVFFPRQVRRERCDPLPAALRLLPDEDEDGDGWRLAGAGAEDPRDPDLPADVVLAGPADVLLLALWQRVPPDDPRIVVVAGDPALAADLLRRPLVP